MKKIIAILLSLALLLGCAAGLAESEEKTTLGTIKVNGEFTFKGILPEGYKLVPFELSDDALLTRIVSDDPAKPTLILSIAFDETYSGVERLNDLDDDALAILEKTFTDTDPYANITYDETAYGTRLIVCRTTGDNYDYLDVLSIYKGYFVELIMSPGKGAPEQRLTDEQIASCTLFLSELDFVSGIEENKVDLANAVFTANITGFSAESKTIDVSLLVPVTLTEWQTISLKEGDTIRIGTDDVEVRTLAYDGDDTIINDEYYLTKREDGLYNAFFYDQQIMTEALQQTFDVPDTLVFLDEINPSSGENLEEAEIKEGTAGEFFSALEKAQTEGVGFDSQNVVVTFDGQGGLVSVVRFYVPWQ